ncbi:MAG: twin-arginine translocation signal domain-containing protein, partial [Mycobacterium sp.]|nr:twin-arginine translocation signal domain-containing protein [Mycobacterium sp.]
MEKKNVSRRRFLQVGGAVGAGALVPTAVWRSLAANASKVRPGSITQPQTHLPGSQIPQFVDPLPTFVGHRVDSPSYQSSVQEFQQRVLPASVYANATPPFNGGTFVWGIKNGTEAPSWP